MLLAYLDGDSFHYFLSLIDVVGAIDLFIQTFSLYMSLSSVYHFSIILEKKRKQKRPDENSKFIFLFVCQEAVDKRRSKQKIKKKSEMRWSGRIQSGHQERLAHAHAYPNH